MNIIKKIAKLSALIAATLLLQPAPGASAASITFNDTYDPASDQLISFGANKSFDFTHSIIADQDGAADEWSGLYGYDPFSDLISSALIELSFKDESSDSAAESVTFTFDEHSFGTQTITSGGTSYIATFSSDLSSLLSDGFLHVTLENAGTTNGQQQSRSDFYFIDSTLTVHVNKAAQAQQVPEPATLALVGLGVFGFVIGRRKNILDYL